MKFTTNVGATDRMIRIVVGIALIGLAMSGIWSPWGWIGVVLLVTGFVKFCPAYTLFGMKTNNEG